MAHETFSRLVILGAGAIGAGIGALLHEAGTNVLLIARGPHRDAMATHGLDLRLPSGPRRLRLPLGTLQDLRPGDLVLLATMGHDTIEATAALPAGWPVVSLQNGEAPLHALDRPVIAAVVYVPAERRAPGVVVMAGSPYPGAILLGGWPSGVVGPEAALAEALRQAGFRTAIRDPIAPWVRAKSLRNLGGALIALCDAPPAELVEALVAEARAVYAAAGLPVANDADFDAAVGPLETVAVDGLPRVGGSTRHALSRGDRLETASLHGPIVALGRQWGVPTPRNTAIIALAEQAAAEGCPAGGMAPAALRAALEQG